MKKYTLVVFLFIAGVTAAQQKKLVWTEITCDTGTEKAKKDFNQGYYFCESIGLNVDTDADFSAFYEKYLYEKYKIIAEHGGCIVTDYRECYSKTMEKLVFEKYGSDLFEKALKEAKELYSEKK